MKTVQKKPKPKYNYVNGVRMSAIEFPLDWKEQIMDLGQNGASIKEMQGYLGIDHNNWYKILRKNRELDETIKKAVLASEIWWEKNGRIALKDKTFNAVLWYMNMKNRFGWKDKTETEIKPTQEILVKFSVPKTAKK